MNNCIHQYLGLFEWIVLMFEFLYWFFIFFLASLFSPYRQLQTQAKLPKSPLPRSKVHKRSWRNRQPPLKNTVLYIPRIPLIFLLIQPIYFLEITCTSAFISFLTYREKFAGQFVRQPDNLLFHTKNKVIQLTRVSFFCAQLGTVF